MIIYYLGVFSKIEKKIMFVDFTERVPTVGQRRDLSTIFKVIYQGLFFGKKYLDVFWGPFRGTKTYSKKKLWVRTFKSSYFHFELIQDSEQIDISEF